MVKPTPPQPSQSEIKKRPAVITAKINTNLIPSRCMGLINVSSIVIKARPDLSV
jgi:hypothetical protein